MNQQQGQEMRKYVRQS